MESTSFRFSSLLFFFVVAFIAGYPDVAVGDGCRHKISVKTASDINAGTNSSIKLTMYDTSGGAMEIPNLADWGVNGTSYDYFQEGKLDIFNGSLACICTNSIVVTSLDSARWKLDYVEIVVEVDEGEVVRSGAEMPYNCSIFKVDQWLDTDKSPYWLSASREPCNIATEGAAESDTRDKVGLVAADDRCEYTITVRTADVQFAGTDSNINMTLGEEHGATIEISNLEDWGVRGYSYEYFEKGSLDIFSGKAACILPCSMKVRSNGSGINPGWKLDFVEVVVAGPRIPIGFHTIFDVYQWLDTDEPPITHSASSNQCIKVRAGSADHDKVNDDDKRSGPAKEL